MGGKIDMYFDCVSPYSWYAFDYLRKNRALLSSYGVEVEFHPFFLGGIVQATGNRPPFTIPAKAAYSSFDSKHASKHFGITGTSTPDFFPIFAILHQRALTYVKGHYSSSHFEDSMEALWSAFFRQHIDVSKPEPLAQVLSKVLPSSEDEVTAILAATQTPEIKKKLKETTDRALKLGAFGAPFFSVTKYRAMDGSKEGIGKAGDEVEPFFGSDRFHYMFDFLELPVSHLRILEKREVGAIQSQGLASIPKAHL